MDERDKLFYERLAKIQEYYKPEDGLGISPYPWKKEWEPILKQDADWSDASFFDLILYKLEKVHLSLDMYSCEYRKHLDKKLKKLQEIIDLGKKIRTFDYYTGSDKFSHDHVTHYVLIYKNNPNLSEMENLKTNDLLHKLERPKRATRDEEIEEDIENEDWFGFKAADNWAKEHGYSKKDYHVALSGEWDDMANHDIWLDMIKQEGKNNQKDINRFFSLIAKNYRHWWW